MQLDDRRNSMSVIRVDNLTKDYGNGKGIFDVTFEVNEGEVFGFLGPNGAGKTTTIRHLLGFSKSSSGESTIFGLNCWSEAKEIQKNIGYLPGEIAFPDDMTGIKFIKYIAGMRGMKDMTKANRLIAMFELDASGDLKRMSKGMKQKVGIVCAFMHDPKVIILDEPTSGLDPLMQAKFVALIKEEKAKGTSILMSSHMFDEVEETTDRIGIIKQGKLVAIVDPKDIRNMEKKQYEIAFSLNDDFLKFQTEDFVISDINAEKHQLTVEIDSADINKLLRSLSKKDIQSISEMKSGLEDYFMSYYDGGSKNV